jgi:salicylate hydroxylase
MTLAERILETPIFDRVPLDTWSTGRVTLLSDAAHAMAPALGQGANSTFEDVCELAWFFPYYKSNQLFSLMLLKFQVLNPYFYVWE